MCVKGLFTCVDDWSNFICFYNLFSCNLCIQSYSRCFSPESGAIISTPYTIILKPHWLLSRTTGSDVCESINVCLSNLLRPWKGSVEQFTVVVVTHCISLYWLISWIILGFSTTAETGGEDRSSVLAWFDWSVPFLNPRRICNLGYIHITRLPHAIPTVLYKNN